jgi:hypothetical protein
VAAKTPELLWTFGLSFVGILALNMMIRVVVKGFDAAPHFSWLGLAIAAGVAVLITLGQAGKRGKNADSQS